MAGDIFGAIGDSINQDKGFALGLVNNAISYSQSKKAQYRAFKYAKELQQHQYDLSLKGYRETPGAKREGLESAGYNPLLALDNINSGANVAGGTPVGANAADGPDLATNAATLQSIKNQTEQTDSTVENLDANTRNQNAEAAGKEIKNQYLDSREKAEIGATEASTSKMNAEVKNMEAFQRFKEQELELMNLGIISQYNSTMFGHNVTKSAVDAQNELTSAQRKFIQEHPILAGLGAAGNSFLPIGAAIGGTYAASNHLYNKFKRRNKVGF